MVLHTASKLWTPEWDDPRGAERRPGWIVVELISSALVEKVGDKYHTFKTGNSTILKEAYQNYSE